MGFTIQFDFGDGAPPWYAGLFKGALGFAPTLESALIWSERETAERFLENGYGSAGTTHGRVIEVTS